MCPSRRKGRVRIDNYINKLLPGRRERWKERRVWREGGIARINAKGGILHHKRVNERILSARNISEGVLTYVRRSGALRFRNSHEISTSHRHFLKKIITFSFVVVALIRFFFFLRRGGRGVRTFPFLFTCFAKTFYKQRISTLLKLQVKIQTTGKPEERTRSHRPS